MIFFSMGKTSRIDSVTRLQSTQCLILFTLFYSHYKASAIEVAATTELVKGFKATPDPSISLFQSLLTDSTHTFSLGFLRVKQTQLALAIVHVPSSEPLWLANPTRLAKWSKSVNLVFNGSLVITDRKTGAIWSSKTDGDSVKLLNTSNLQVVKLGESTNSDSVIWESFNYPVNTLVENQNFTSAMSLVSSNGLYYMKLGDDFMGLYANFRDGDNSGQIYLKQKALQAKAEIIKGKGPIYARISPDGYLGMYQLNDSLPVDVQAFNSFNRPINGFLITRLESDGNLKGYYWDGSNWVLDYKAIQAQCELPSPCGAYGLCRPGTGCSCLDNRTIGVCSTPQSGDFCNGGIAENGFSVLRRKGIELPYKELMAYKTVASLEVCEDLCEKDCICWGSVYNNASGFCYMVNYPIQTLLSVGDESKVGYFKVRKGAQSKVDAGFKFGIGLMGGVLLLIIGLIGFGARRIWKRRRSERRNKMYFEEENGMSPGPYKDLASASFRSIELSSSNR